MKIVKEVSIKATKADTWAWLRENKILKELLDPGNGNKAALSKTSFRLHNSIRMSAEPPEKVRLFEGTVPSIHTILELQEQGPRTKIRVTISGWETIGVEAAKVEIPRISLAWEKRLGLIKKAIEYSSRKSHTVK